MFNKFSDKHPYLSVVLLCILCTVLTAIGSAIPQIIGLGEEFTYIVMSVFIALSALIGLLIMKKFKFSLSEYGFKGFSNTSKRVLFYIPLIIIEILPIVFYGFSKEISPVIILLILLFTITVGFNEEIYFRGLALKIIEHKGMKKAIIFTAILFGVLHIVNIFNGKDILYVILQIIFAFLVGFTLAELLSVTKSIWLLIIWHILHDFIAMTTNDTVDSSADLVLLAIQVVILFSYSISLWRKVK